MNSFAVFLTKSVDDETKSAFLKCETMTDVNTVLGAEFVEEKLAEFDAENQRYIELYDHYLNQLYKSCQLKIKVLIKLLESFQVYFIGGETANETA